jgi:hypothetical protein
MEPCVQNSNLNQVITKKKSGHLSKTIPKVCPFIMNEAPTYNVKHI